MITKKNILLFIFLINYHKAYSVYYLQDNFYKLKYILQNNKNLFILCLLYFGVLVFCILKNKNTKKQINILKKECIIKKNFLNKYLVKIIYEQKNDILLPKKLEYIKNENSYIYEIKFIFHEKNTSHEIYKSNSFYCITNSRGNLLKLEKSPNIFFNYFYNTKISSIKKNNIFEDFIKKINDAIQHELINKKKLNTSSLINYFSKLN